VLKSKKIIYVLRFSRNRTSGARFSNGALAGPATDPRATAGPSGLRAQPQNDSGRSGEKSQYSCGKDGGTGVSAAPAATEAAGSRFPKVVFSAYGGRQFTPISTRPEDRNRLPAAQLRAGGVLARPEVHHWDATKAATGWTGPRRKTTIPSSRCAHRRRSIEWPL
jgi:hypothetical protein